MLRDKERNVRSKVMLNCKVQTGFATLNVNTQVVGQVSTHIALNAYVVGQAQCLSENPDHPHLVEIMVQGQKMWVEAECLSDSEFPDLPFEFIITERAKAAA